MRKKEELLSTLSMWKRKCSILHSWNKSGLPFPERLEKLHELTGIPKKEIYHAVKFLTMQKVTNRIVPLYSELFKLENKKI